MATPQELDRAFEKFSAQISALAMKVNETCIRLKKGMNGTEFQTHGNTSTGDGRAIRDYEDALEELKAFIENRTSGHVHNDSLSCMIGTDKHAIRGLEVELVHPKVKNGPPEVLVDEHIITGVVVRGFISIQPADGNEQPNYSSKSSSSSVPRT